MCLFHHMQVLKLDARLCLLLHVITLIPPFYLNFKGDPENWSHSRCPGLHLIWLFLWL